MIDVKAYYLTMKTLAHEVRASYSICTKDVSLSTIRRVYRDQGIRIDRWPYKLRKVRAAYLLMDGEPHVLLNANMKPKEPQIFALCHEPKHHLADQEIAKSQVFGCQDISWQAGNRVEIAAEIFAAELIFPEAEFLSLVTDLDLTKSCSKEDVVRLKRASVAPISYAFLQKRLEWFRLIPRNAFRGVQFRKLEEQLYGVPFYRRRYLARVAP